MTDHPILFTGAMVRAVLDGSKTQTRRIIKGLDADRTPHMYPDYTWVQTKNVYVHQDKPLRCPFGKPSDQLWVREKFRVWEHSNCEDPLGTDEVVTGPVADLAEEWGYDIANVEYAAGLGLAGDLHGDNQWRPSIHMPRWASRIDLDVLDVRVERVRDISEADIRAEGVSWDAHIEAGSWLKAWMNLWDSINGDRRDAKTGERLPYAWKDNPRTFVVEFKQSERTT